MLLLLLLLLLLPSVSFAEAEAEAEADVEDRNRQRVAFDKRIVLCALMKVFILLPACQHRTTDTSDGCSDDSRRGEDTKGVNISRILLIHSKKSFTQSLSNINAYF